MPAPVAALSKAWVCDGLNTETGGFESHRAVDIGTVTCCKVYVSAAVDRWSRAVLSTVVRR